MDDKTQPKLIHSPLSVRQLDGGDSREAEIADMGAPTVTALVMSASTSSGQTPDIIDAHF